MSDSQSIIDNGRAAALLLEDPTIAALLEKADARCWEATLEAKTEEHRARSIMLALAYRSIRGELAAMKMAGQTEEKRTERKPA
jgi:hypothetical protein